jgi:hypothetical protein
MVQHTQSSKHNTIQYVTEWKTKITIISKDAGKPLDKIKHPFMIKAQET